jgi:hypothetical protein
MGSTQNYPTKAIHTNYSIEKYRHCNSKRGVNYLRGGISPTITSVMDIGCPRAPSKTRQRLELIEKPFTSAPTCETHAKAHKIDV